jgi:hypothetical protein
VPFHLLAYDVNAGVNDVNVDVPAVTDSIFSVRNNHYIFSEQYQIVAAAYHAASALRVRSNVPTWNAIGRHMVHPLRRSITQPDLPAVQDLRDFPLLLPQNEEIAWEESNNLGAATERSKLYLWLATMDWSRNVTRGVQIIMLRATATITTVADTWSGLNALVFADSIRGGWYTVIGAEVQAANTTAFRLFFPRSNYIGGRQLRPGGLAQDAIGNQLWDQQIGYLGNWGRFHSFELPQIEVFATAAASTAHEVRLLLAYEGSGGGYQ